MNLPSLRDLTKEPPRSPRVRLGGFVILGRTVDKGRAMLKGIAGDYHFDCPLDNVLFGFKGVTGDQLKEKLLLGASDEEVADWLTTRGTPKTESEIRDWGDAMEKVS